MARQVMFDPFGRYTEGFNQGANTGVGLAQATNGLRQQNWDYFNMNPLRLQEAQRQNVYGNAQLPVALANVDNPYALQRAQITGLMAPFASEFGAASGNYAPYAGLLGRAFGYNVDRGPDNNFDYYQTGPNGERTNQFTGNPTDVANVANRDWAMRQAAANAQMLQAMGMYNYRNTMGAYYPEMAYGRLYEGEGRLGQGQAAIENANTRSGVAGGRPLGGSFGNYSNGGGVGSAGGINTGGQQNQGGGVNTGSTGGMQTNFNTGQGPLQ